MNETLIVLIAGAIVGILPVLIKSLLSWAEKRSAHEKENRSIDLAQKKIGFLKSWFEIQLKINTPDGIENIRKALDAELLELKASTFKYSFDFYVEKDISKPKNLFKRIFLIYQPKGLAGWILRMAFFGFLGMVIFSLATKELGYGLVQTIVLTDNSINLLEKKELDPQIIAKVSILNGKKYKEVPDVKEALAEELKVLLPKDKVNNDIIEFILDSAEEDHRFSYEEFVIEWFVLLFVFIFPIFLIHWVVCRIEFDYMEKLRQKQIEPNQKIKRTG